ncbi:hypothetical protein, partial [Burkholderia gladioli]|uniref:hypothetical protein n=1 Tax=Burkholderia gladioli TaxID=28095 RepID=UPI001E48256D
GWAGGAGGAGGLSTAVSMLTPGWWVGAIRPPPYAAEISKKSDFLICENIAFLHARAARC